MRVTKPVGARCRSVAICEISRTGEGIHVDKRSDSSVAFEPYFTGKCRIITGPACARLRDIAGRYKGSERCARSISRDPGNLPSTHERAGKFVVGAEHAPLSKRQVVSVERVEEVRLIRRRE